MADTKTTALTELAVAPASTDILMIVDDPAGTPVSKKISVDNLLKTLPADAVDAITEIAAALKSGSDGTLITGTAGTNGDLSQWNVDGDLVDGPTPPSGAIVGTTDTQTLTNKTLDADNNTISNLEIGNEVSGTAQGALDMNDNNLEGHLTNINAQTGTTYTLVLSDSGKTVTMDNASANTLTIPTNASVAFAVGTQLSVWQKGAGATTIAGDTGVTLNGVSAGSGAINNQYAAVTLLKIATDTWMMTGDHAAVA